MACRIRKIDIRGLWQSVILAANTIRERENNHGKYNNDNNFGRAFRRLWTDVLVLDTHITDYDAPVRTTWHTWPIILTTCPARLLFF